MANDENKIILEFPATNVEIEFGETITFDNISGFLDSDRVTYNGESLTEEIAHLENDKADNTKIAPEYDEEETYYRGDIVLYNGVLYERDNTDASGEFNPSDWKEITLGEGIEDVRDLLADYYTKSQSDYRFLGKTNPSGTGYLSLNRRGSTGAYSVSVGRLNEASAQSSFAEGEGNTSSGYASHSEGYGNAASGLMAHAEGVTTESSGYGSHSEGVGTIANHIGQHVFGTYNVADTSTAEPTAKGNYIEIVGNGTDDNRRRNARTLDWSGNETLMGDLTYNGNKSLTSEISRLDGKIDNLPAPMIFKGTLGVGGTIQSLPDASASNEGYTYKVITDGTYAGQNAKVGDVFTSNGSAWVLIPSGDEDNDTWRAIKVNGVEKLGNGISGGAVDFVGSDNIEVDFDGNGNKVGVKTKNIYTKTEVDDIVYGILPDDTASGSVANFETDLALPLKSLEIDVNAKQDLHGYDYPWVAGGGDNVMLLSPNNKSGTVFGVTYSYDAETGKITLSGTNNNTNAHALASFKPLEDELITPNFQVGETYTLSVYLPQNTMYCQFTYKDTNNTTRAMAYKRGTGSFASVTFTVPDNFVELIQFAIYVDGTATTLSGEIYFELVKGSTAPTSYEPYENICPIEGWDAITLDVNGNTEVINLGGTYYGGYVSQDKEGHRKLTVTMSQAIAFKGNETFTMASDNRFFYTAPTDIIQPTVSTTDLVKCSHFSSGTQGSQANGTVWKTIGNRIIAFKDTSISDLTAWANFLTTQYNNGTPVTLLYKLATPITIDLPDGEPIITLNGTNNIYADTGDCAVEYKCSVAEYVANHSGGSGAKSLGGVFLGGSNSGSEEEPTEESEDTEKVKLDETKVEINAIGDDSNIKKLGGD